MERLDESFLDLLLDELFEEFLVGFCCQPVSAAMLERCWAELLGEVQFRLCGGPLTTGGQWLESTRGHTFCQQCGQTCVFVLQCGGEALQDVESEGLARCDFMKGAGVGARC